MNSPNQMSERQRELRKRYGQMTINLVAPQIEADPPHIEEIGDEINELIREERLSEARELATTQLVKYQGEPRILKLLMIIEILEKTEGNYEKAKDYGCEALRASIEKDNSLHIGMTINNLGCICQHEGDYKLAEALFHLARYFVRDHLAVLRNLAGLYSELGRLDESWYFIERILQTFPEALKTNNEIIGFFVNSTALHNMRRDYPAFRENVLNKIEPKVVSEMKGQSK